MRRRLTRGVPALPLCLFLGGSYAAGCAASGEDPGRVSEPGHAGKGETGANGPALALPERSTGAPLSEWRMVEHSVPYTPIEATTKTNFGVHFEGPEGTALAMVRTCDETADPKCKNVVTYAIRGEIRILLKTKDAVPPNLWLHPTLAAPNTQRVGRWAHEGPGVDSALTQDRLIEFDLRNDAVYASIGGVVSAVASSILARAEEAEQSYALGQLLDRMKTAIDELYSAEGRPEGDIDEAIDRAMTDTGLADWLDGADNDCYGGYVLQMALLWDLAFSLAHEVDWLNTRASNTVLATLRRATQLDDVGVERDSRVRGSTNLYFSGGYTTPETSCY